MPCLHNRTHQGQSLSHFEFFPLKERSVLALYPIFFSHIILDYDMYLQLFIDWLIVENISICIPTLGVDILDIVSGLRLLFNSN